MSDSFHIQPTLPAAQFRPGDKQVEAAMVYPTGYTAPVRILFATGNAHKVEEVGAFLTEAGLHVELSAQDTQVEETGHTFLENARLKAEALRLQLAMQPSVSVPTSPVDYILAEDSGLVVPVLSGLAGLHDFPGVRSNRWLTSDWMQQLTGSPLQGDQPSYQELNQALLALMHAAEARHAHEPYTVWRRAAFVCAMVLLPVSNHPGSNYTTLAPTGLQVEGHMPLVISTHGPSGSGGFGYDPVVHAVVDGHLDSRTVAEWSTAEKNQHSHRSHALRQVAAWLREHHPTGQFRT
ncbi:MAG: non-canonical purine NTP pyrophosphatase [Candidatus Melainabacteria bacterium]|nr:non-canonical purine NTP pyrophosphatase [Candidatus Melainabacteria bacterium]